MELPEAMSAESVSGVLHDICVNNSHKANMNNIVRIDSLVSVKL